MLVSDNIAGSRLYVPLLSDTKQDCIACSKSVQER